MLLGFLKENTCLEAVLCPEENKALLMAAITTSLHVNALFTPQNERRFYVILSLTSWCSRPAPWGAVRWAWATLRRAPGHEGAFGASRCPGG